MNQIQHLQEQAARAERLARNALDTLTVERLSAFAAECRHQIELLAEEPDADGPGTGRRMTPKRLLARLARRPDRS